MSGLPPITNHVHAGAEHSGTPREIIRVEAFSAFHGEAAVLRDVHLSIIRNKILGVMGPAQSGKTTLLRSLNRMNDLTPGVRHTGSIYLEGLDIHSSECDPAWLRRLAKHRCERLDFRWPVEMRVMQWLRPAERIS